MSNLQPPVNAYTGSEPFLFVSYAHADKSTVYPIIEELTKKGARIWYDEGIPASSNWIKEIASTLIKCTCFLVLITPQALSSEHVRDEINFAKQKKKRMFVVYLENTELPIDIEFQIGSIQALFKHMMTEEAFWRKLLSELTEVISTEITEPVKKEKELDKEIEDVDTIELEKKVIEEIQNRILIANQLVTKNNFDLALKNFIEIQNDAQKKGLLDIVSEVEEMIVQGKILKQEYDKLQEIEKSQEINEPIYWGFGASDPFFPFF